MELADMRDLKIPAATPKEVRRTKGKGVQYDKNHV